MFQQFFVILFFYSTLASCTTPEKIKNNLDSLFQHCFDNNLFNGHVLIYKKGEIIYNSSFGKLSYNSQEAITEKTPFRLASLSKQFTAMTIVDLQSKGLISYDDPVIKYCPDFPYDQITIRHLLNHTSGLPDYQNKLNYQYDELIKEFDKNGTYVENETISNFFKKQTPDLEFDPGTGFNYSNSGYVYLATIVEKITNEPFGTYLHDNYFQPLDMKNTWVVDTFNSDRKKAIGYKRDLITKTFKKNESPEFLKVVGDGAIYSSAKDLMKWFHAIDTGKVVGSEELTEAYSCPNIGEEQGPYGFGWFVRTLPFNGNKALTHSGEFAGFSNALFRDLDNNTTVIMLSNNSHKVRSEINSAVIRILYGVSFDLPKISAAMALSDMIISGKTKESKQYYNANLKNELYDFSEKAFNSFGYELLNSEKYTQAIEIFEWNIEMNPESSNVYDSLGEAYLKVGDVENAIKNYSIAFEMDPKNENAKKTIDRLKAK